MHQIGMYKQHTIMYKFCGYTFLNHLLMHYPHNHDLLCVNVKSPISYVVVSNGTAW